MMLYLRMTLGMLVSKEKSFLSAILLTAFSFILMGIAGMYLYVGKVNEKLIDHCATGGIERTGVIKLTDFADEQDLVDLKKDCMQLESVKAVGSLWNNQEMMNMAEWDIANPQEKEVRTYALDRSALGLMQFRLYKSLAKDEGEKVGKDYLPDPSPYA